MSDSHILLITDRMNVAEALVQDTSLEQNQIDIASTEQQAFTLFDSIKPGIIIFYMSTVDTSEDLYFDMYKQSEQIRSVKHRAIVMCEEAEVAKANAKCMRNIFFDYVVFSPGFDRIRINLLLKNALKSIQYEEMENRSRQYESAGKVVTMYSNKMADSMSTAKLTADSKKSFAKLSSAIKNDIKDFSSDLIARNNSASTPLTEKHIEHEVNHFSDHVLDKTIESSRDNFLSILDAYSSRVEENKQQFKSSLSDLTALSASAVKKILIVEDNEIYGEMVRVMLEKVGSYEVKLVTTVYQGMVDLVCDRPDIVLLDYQLPDGDASVFLEKSSAIQSVKSIPVIILTSHNNSDVYNSTAMLGAKAFIAKPASREIIMNIVEKYI